MNADLLFKIRGQIYNTTFILYLYFIRGSSKFMQEVNIYRGKHHPLMQAIINEMWRSSLDTHKIWYRKYFLHMFLQFFLFVYDIFSGNIRFWWSKIKMLGAVKGMEKSTPQIRLDFSSWHCKVRALIPQYQSFPFLPMVP